MNALRARGLRFTTQRQQVLVAVRELGHATPEEVSARLPEVDLTTVYRTLQLLEEIGLLAHTHLGHGAPSYRPFDDHHIHLVCHQCGAVSDADPGMVDPLTRRLADQQGFAVDLAHFTVFGRCARCTADAGAAVAQEPSAPGREQSQTRAGTIGARAAMT
ncbi:MAG: transcriptional repressor [Actinomycetota bacterium]|nr:transcriptional repressor [Actinomycetota bacterium]